MAHYVTVTGDDAVLDEAVPFLEVAVLRDGESRGIAQATLDGVAQSGGRLRVPLADDRATHQLRLVLE